MIYAQGWGFCLGIKTHGSCRCYNIAQCDIKCRMYSACVVHARLYTPPILRPFDLPIVSVCVM